MNLRTTRAVVSKIMKMSNSSKLVTLITENHGLIKVVAKGARRPRSAFGASLEPITLINCIYYHRDTRDLQSLSSTDIIESYGSLKEDLSMLAVASGIVEIAQTHTALEDPRAGTFDLLVESLNDMCESAVADAEKHLWRFVLRLLSAAGYQPSLDTCMKCGRKAKSAKVFFSFPDGGLVCSCTDTSGTFGIVVSPGSLMVMKHLLAARPGELAKLRVGKSQRGEIEHLVLQYLAYHTGASRPPKSLAFLRKLQAAGKS